MRQSIRKPLLLLSIACAVPGCQSAGNHSPWRLNSLLAAKRSAPGAAAAAPSAALAGSVNSANSNPTALRTGGDIGHGAATFQPNSPNSTVATASHATQASAQLMRKTVGSLRDSLRIDPKVIPAKDPTNLQFDPGPLQPDLYVRAAQLMESRGQLDEAQGQYERLLEFDPNNRSALVGLARLQHRRGSMDAAIAGYQRALRVAGNDPVILNDLGLCLARTGRTAEAIRTLQAALVAKPDSLLYRNNLAAVLIETKQIPLAVQTLAQTQGSAVANYNVGYLLHQRGDIKGAYDHFTLALQADPSLGPARTMLDRIAPQIGQRPPVRAAATRGIPISATMGVPSGVALPSGQQPVVQAMALVHAGATTDQPSGEVMRVQFEEPVAPISTIPRADAPATDGSSSAVPPLRLPQRALRPQTGGAWIPPDPPSMPLAPLP